MFGFGSLFGDVDDLIGSHMSQMSNAMNQIMGGGMNQMMAGGMNQMMGGGMNQMMAGGINQMMGRGVNRNQLNLMSPFPSLTNGNQLGLNPMLPMLPMMGGGLMGMGGVNSLMQQMSSNPNCQSFSSSSFVSMTNGSDGKPHVYQESSSTRTGPGGIRETKRAVNDSRTGVKQLTMGRHINDRGHVRERMQNVYSGEQEENEEFINIEEEEADHFNKEWQSKAGQASGTSRGNNYAITYPYPQQNNGSGQLALPPPPFRASNEGAMKKEKLSKRSKPYDKNQGSKKTKKP